MLINNVELFIYLDSKFREAILAGDVAKGWDLDAEMEELWETFSEEEQDEINTYFAAKEQDEDDQEGYLFRERYNDFPPEE